MKNLLALSVAVSTLAACVTINIYFPAAATEKAADKIIDEVWQTQSGLSKKTDEKPAENNPAVPNSAVPNSSGEVK
jgi:predicted small lipoprotein YifL